MPCTVGSELLLPLQQECLLVPAIMKVTLGIIQGMVVFIECLSSWQPAFWMLLTYLASASFPGSHFLFFFLSTTLILFISCSSHYGFFSDLWVQPASSDSSKQFLWSAWTRSPHIFPWLTHFHSSHSLKVTLKNLTSPCCSKSLAIYPQNSCSLTHGLALFCL